MYEKELVLLSCIHQVCKDKKLVANSRRFEIYNFTHKDLVKIAQLSKFKLFGNKIGECSICNIWLKAAFDKVNDIDLAYVSSSIPFYYDNNKIYSIYNALELLTQYEDKKIKYTHVNNEIIYNLDFEIAKDLLKDYYIFKKNKSYIEIPSIKVKYAITGNNDTTIVGLR